MKKKHRLKKRTLFNPDELVTSISQAIRRDSVPFDHEYEGDGDLVRHALSRQLRDFDKKYQSNSSYDKDALEKDCFLKWIENNNRLRRYDDQLPLRLPDRHTRIQRTLPFMDKVHLRARALMHFVVGCFSEDELFLCCKHGTGSSIGVPFVDTSLERKFTFPLSTTERSKPFFERYLDFDPLLKSALIEFNKRPFDKGCYLIVDGSRATTVDKTNDKRRFIAVEPTVNMFLQQGLMAMLYRRMKSVGLDVRHLPQAHRELARISSITGENATIDWSQASDCVLTELLRWLLPDEWFSMVDAVRSPCTIIEIPDGARCREHLSMFATMGNATTFPLETLVFWTYAHAVRLSLTESNTLYPEWDELMLVSVFGDDCIVPSSMASTYVDVMESIGFKVNLDKTYLEPNGFRESCGGDYLHGFDIRPFHVKAPPNLSRSSLEPWLYVILNAIYPRYILYFGRTGYVYRYHFFQLIFGLFREYGLKFKIVPPYFPDDSGFKHISDVARLNRCYDIPWSAVYQDEHGKVSFLFCQFKYWQSSERDEFIRYANWLKKPTLHDDALWTAISRLEIDPRRGWLNRLSFDKDNELAPMFRPKREKGGYVVARGFSAHWTVPGMEPGTRIG